MEGAGDNCHGSTVAEEPVIFFHCLLVTFQHPFSISQCGDQKKQ